jgi:peptidoglycan/LPS O-acetylase OafA/YrhL
MARATALPVPSSPGMALTTWQPRQWSRLGSLGQPPAVSSGTCSSTKAMLQAASRNVSDFFNSLLVDWQHLSGKSLRRFALDPLIAPTPRRLYDWTGVSKGISSLVGFLGMSDRLLVLDAQRGLCALFVALLHSKGVSHIHDSAFVQGSWLFVDFFFVLSGFVIALVYLDQIDSAVSFKAFVIRRFGRLWPLHAFVLLLYIVSEAIKVVAQKAGLPVHVTAFTGSTSVGAIGANLMLVHSLGLGNVFTWNHPSWSISVEFYTYLIFALLCISVRRWMKTAAVTLIGISIAVLLLCGTQYLGASLDLGIFRCCYGFFVGVLTFFGYRAVRRRGGRLLTASALEIGILIAVVLFISGAHDGPLTMIAPIIFGSVVFVFAFEAGAVSRLLQRPIFVWLGDRSYAIYMIHFLVGDTIVRVLLSAAAATPHFHALRVTTGADNVGLTVSFGDRFLTDLYVIFYVAATLLCADLVHRTVERPARSLFKRAADSYLRSRQTVAVSALT